MSASTLRIVIAGVLFVHGVGHFMGVMPALRLVNVEGWNSHSWLLTDRLGDTTGRVISIVLFLAALARKPMPGELSVGLQLMEKDRKRGAEKIQWAMLNNTDQ